MCLKHALLFFCFVFNDCDCCAIEVVAWLDCFNHKQLDCILSIFFNSAIYLDIHLNISHWKIPQFLYRSQLSL